MPTRKQRRRQQKSRRHEYEYVYVDDEGNEVEFDPGELQQESNGKRDARAPKPKQDRGKQGGRARTGRAMEPPSWRRATRRGLIFAPVLVVAMMFLNRNLTLAQQIAPALLMIGFFIPFSYFTDSVAYRMYKKRTDRGNAAKSR
jgi:hypothetical protein